MKHPTHKPTSARYVVILFAVGLAVVTYLQRHAIAFAIPDIQRDLGLNKLQMGLAISAFLWMYALYEIPAGFAGDRWGSRRVLAVLVGVWSFSLAATGWVWNLASLVVMRGCFGAAQAGCFPNIARMFSDWLPKGERVRAQGIMWLSARWGGAAAPLIVALFLTHLNWRIAFAVFGLLGFVWVGIFYWWFRDNPSEHPGVNSEELKLLPPNNDSDTEKPPIRWWSLFRSKTVWLLCGQYMCLNFGWQFYVTWLPTYLLEARQLDLAKAAWLAGLPLFFGGLGSLCCGVVSSWLDRVSGSVKTSRRLLSGTGFTVAAICFALSIHIRSPIWAMVALGVASFANDLVMPTSWATCMDVGGRLSGTLAGTMNMMGGFLGAAAPMVVAAILFLSNDNWAITFYVSAGIYFMGTFFWLFLDPVTPIDEGVVDSGGA